MWKKGEMPEQDRHYERDTAPSLEPPISAPRGGQAVIGRSITIKGEVTGDEDLVIQGRVDGSVILDQHSVTVGPEGQVKANITGRIVTVEGRVEGNVTGDEQVVLRKASWVQGDIKAPRVVLEDGAHFRGGVTMGEEIQGRRAAQPVQKTAQSEPVRQQPTVPIAAPAVAQAAPAAHTGGRQVTANVKG